MDINKTNNYLPNAYSTNTSTNYNTKVNTDTKTDKVSGKHPHHRHHSGNSTDKSKNIQSNGTDSIQISKEGIDAVSSATRKITYGQPYNPNRTNSNSNPEINTTTPSQSTVGTEE